MKERLRSELHRALVACREQGSLIVGEVPEIQIETPAHAQHGDFATNLAMVLARSEKRPPRKIAEILVAALGDGGGFWKKLEIAGPGFINFHLSPASWFALLEEVVAGGDGFGCSSIGRGRRVQVEFVSANPTGPLHIGHGRGAAVGDVLASVLAAAGYRVEREYYINDAGNQMATLGRSLLVRYRQEAGERIDFPEGHYRGDYMIDLARELLEEEGPSLLELPEEEAVARLTGYAGRRILAGIDDDLQKFGVRFDRWYSEQSLYDRGEVSRALELLRQKNLAYESEGALWLRTTDFGDDKDRVLVRSNGETTYFASDIAYHLEKFERGFDQVIDIWGADHHGYVPRLRAALAALGRDPEDLQILLVQLVNLLRGGEQVAMSTRAGEFVTLREVVDEVGADACRFFFLMRRSDTSLDFDLELAKEQSSENPVYYVQYAHARVCSINRNAVEAGLAVPAPGSVDLSRLELEEELSLTRLLTGYPDVVEAAARHFEPHRITYFLQTLAAQFHSYYNRHRIIGEEPESSLARLFLVNAVRIVLANGLRLLGVSAPERM